MKIMTKQDVYVKLKHLLNNLDKINKLEILRQDFIFNEKDSILEILEAMNIILFELTKKNTSYLNCIKIVENAKMNIQANGNFEMCIDNLLLTLWEEINEKNSRS